MLKNYDHDQPWAARCTMVRGRKRCNDDPKDWRYDYPAALRERLEESGYL